MFRSTKANAHIPQGRVTSTLKHRQAHLSPLRGRQAGRDQLPGAQAGAHSGRAELARARGVLQAGCQQRWRHGLPGQGNALAQQGLQQLWLRLVGCIQEQRLAWAHPLATALLCVDNR